MSGRPCVYCGWPRARMRDASSRVVELPSCRGHVDLLMVDPEFAEGAYLATLDEAALVDELASAIRSRAGVLPRAAAPARAVLEAV
jgi:hypothetical protein